MLLLHLVENLNLKKCSGISSGLLLFSLRYKVWVCSWCRLDYNTSNTVATVTITTCTGSSGCPPQNNEASNTLELESFWEWKFQHLFQNKEVGKLILEVEVASLHLMRLLRFNAHFDVVDKLQTNQLAAVVP